MYRLLSRAEVVACLSAHGAEFHSLVRPGCECWKTSWDFFFWLTPEDTGMYHEFMVHQAVTMSIEPDLKRRNDAA